MSKPKRLTVTTDQAKQVIDITEQVQQLVDKDASACVVYVAHTTCAITTADLDPGTDLDLLDAVWEMIPNLQYRHPHNPAHVPAHLATSIIGTSATIPVENGQLILGTWQRVILIDLDGPQQRNLVVTSL
ncbi:MAG: secondary thiamine-phosphate synthase enzyme YjbQ [Patescibacteria group bacterium]